MKGHIGIGSVKDSWKRLIGRHANTSVVVPALNEAATIAHVIALARSSKRVGEVIVVDDGSIDDTVAIAQESGAHVITSTHLGKGASMADGLREARFPLVVFLDGDLKEISEDTVDRLVRPLEKGHVDLVKGRFSRSQGRVTELVAKPLLRLFFPELGAIHQPLSGQMAVVRQVGRGLRLENDYGVDVGLLIDVSMSGGQVVEVDLGHLEHRHHDLHDLSDMAFQISQTILQRAQHYGRIDGAGLSVMRSVHRQMEAAMDGFSSLGAKQRTVLLDVDCVFPSEPLVSAAAKHLGFADAGAAIINDQALSGAERIASFGRLFKGISQETLATLAAEAPLGEGAVQTVIDLRRLGYSVGIMSDYFLISTEVARRRVFADFSVGHMLDYKHGRCTGEVRFTEAYAHPDGCRLHDPCKSNILCRLAERGIAAQNVVAVGRGAPDACLVAKAGLGIAFSPRDEACRQAADIVVDGPDLNQLVAHLAEPASII